MAAQENAMMSGKWVHKNNILFTPAHDFRGNLIVGEYLAALFRLFFLSHTGPDIGIDDIGAFSCFQGFIRAQYLRPASGGVLSRGFPQVRRF